MPIKIKNFRGEEIYTDIGKVKALTPRPKIADKIIYKSKHGRMKKRRLFNKKIVNTPKVNLNNNKERIRKEDEKHRKYLEKEYPLWFVNNKKNSVFRL